uniref:Uncharacterized protein n=1 Tax=Oryza meridionalis TaxID=40149 RepID=A0A0E0F7X8_9ORYZ
MVEFVIDGDDLEFTLSYEEDELSFLFEKSNELMLKDQEMFQRQIENFGYAFIYGVKEVILTDDEDEEGCDILSDDDEDISIARHPN